MASVDFALHMGEAKFLAATAALRENGSNLGRKDVVDSNAPFFYSFSSSFSSSPSSCSLGRYIVHKLEVKNTFALHVDTLHREFMRIASFIAASSLTVMRCKIWKVEK